MWAAGNLQSGKLCIVGQDALQSAVQNPRSQAGKFPYENEIQDPQPSEPPQICRTFPPNNLPFQDFPEELLLLDCESNRILDGKFSWVG